MLKKENFTLDHIQEIKENRKIDPFLLERTVYALGLLESLVRVDMPFVFKGGTSLMLLLEKPGRLSTDIDIIVKPGTDVRHFIHEASKIFPFKKSQEQIRKGKNNIVKQHFMFWYDSPVSGNPFYILLDILFEENHYSAFTRKKIKNDLILTEAPYLEVQMPSVDCILGDKLTAFAPHTTGIPFGVNKELEIIKQLFDVANLTEVCSIFSDIYDSYMATAKSEIGYRGINIQAEDALMDSIEAAACIASRGAIHPEEYLLYLGGIRSVMNHIYSERFSGERAASISCKVMYIAACVLKNHEFQRIIDATAYARVNISDSRFKKLAPLRKLDLEAYAYTIETVRLLDESAEK